MPEGRYQIEQASNGEWYYNLVGANGEILATSETYTTHTDAVRAADEARDASAGSEIVEEQPDPPEAI